MSNKPPLIIGNWKLNPLSSKAAIALASDTLKACRGVTQVQIGIAPTTVHLSEVGKRIIRSKVVLVAQTVSQHPVGAYTGEISAAQLKDIGVSHVIIGHSERRAAGETDKEVQKKIAAVLKAGMTPVVCIGEQKRDESGNFLAFVAGQVKSLAAGLSKTEIRKVVIAYEPIWAIGTGQTASVDDVREMQLFIYKTLTKQYDKNTADSVQLLYGGSVKPFNAAELHLQGGMNGFLVGGASLKADDFGKIVKAIQ
jgi:triosephosphate isomerase